MTEYFFDYKTKASLSLPQLFPIISNSPRWSMFEVPNACLTISRARSAEREKLSVFWQWTKTRYTNNNNEIKKRYEHYVHVKF